MKWFDKITGSTRAREREFEKMYNLYARKIYGFAIRLTGGDAYLSEEILQTTFMRLWEHWDELRDKETALTYLFSIAKNTFLNYCEHETVHHIYEEYVLRHGDEASEESEQKQDAESLENYLKEIVECMPPVRRKVFVMSRYEHKSNREIAQALQISEKTVEVHITLALRELRNRLND
ncbi:MAG: RNA polymerase sigma-70 factor [Paludibacteraceae bacterium]|nr:RNA polymerase sigma-70 factor [Paludibacteraceae bacterium]